MTLVAIRVDASANMGTGHLTRCLSLTHALLEQGAQVILVTRALDAVAAQVLSRETPCCLHWLPAPSGDTSTDTTATPHAAWARVSWFQDAEDTANALRSKQPDWIVVDHYAFDARWHETVRTSLGCRLLVIDDTADRAISADVLLDPNWAPDHRAKYAGRLACESRWLAGPRYALLSPAYRSGLRYAYQPKVSSLGIFMGGTDPEGVSARVLDACRAAGFVGLIEVVSTSANPRLDALREVCAADSSVMLTVDQSDLSAFFARHDLQIGAGGGATWERCCVGAPTVALVMAANQSAVVAGLAELGAVRSADEATLPGVLRELIADPTARLVLSERAAALVDGRGAQRVALMLLRDHLQLRPATPDDASQLHAWRNHLSVRVVSVSQDTIAFDAHQRWLHAVLENPARWLFVAQIGQLPVGSIRFDWLDSGHVEVSLYTDPDLQGLGLGQRLLAAGEQALLALHPGGFTLEAQVLPGNTASQRLFQVAGYHWGALRYRKLVGPLPASEYTES
ncbi:UDP-2,4-diacetamido-2,4,6-trideoxy-beta-L-altropyranose hydrolase [Acidovorax sp. Root568]|uniref:UDP-2,4-diacetamido-2,4, 6-trideoxy-beta-L-altropyranose hydrolase n=1 Tax=Acidovorax sp. Root568 TaxID=1736565 RepID=UPI0009E7CA4C|nr:UDP-2,4-diacetamido-2,4,6-trideoxy-beta-L-altropyranose hydrolase [Acidovorax sp. Root568]